MLSPFPAKYNRITTALAEERNRFVGALADQIFVPRADSASKTARLCHTLLASKKTLYTVADTANEHLVAQGATPVSVSQSQGFRDRSP
jgi:hypothetical protein